MINLSQVPTASSGGADIGSTGILPVGQADVLPGNEFFWAGKMPTDPTAKMAVLLLEPALRIFRVVERHCLFGELERVLCVKHNRQLFGPGGILARHDRPGMRAMRNAARM